MNKGCDASIFLDDSNGNKSHRIERDAIPNKTLKGFDKIDMIKEELEKVCPGVASCADTIALATRDGIVLVILIAPLCSLNIFFVYLIFLFFSAAPICLLFTFTVSFITCFCCWFFFYSTLLTVLVCSSALMVFIENYKVLGLPNVNSITIKT
ncbi:peroxidase domain-containing protein [Cephalotus follicularis]|uniref:peroxidase n=1 Tax=Cephalotus follicularis TaxID=3775 RepID=A0A1Q3AQC6_CEPFO|nr:peroxidase domain-containing protein [Cephalotus follicularis]